jgi:hypothetical protein
MPQFIDRLLTLFASDAEERSLDRMVEQSFRPATRLRGPYNPTKNG